MRALLLALLLSSSMAYAGSMPYASTSIGVTPVTVSSVTLISVTSTVITIPNIQNLLVVAAFQAGSNGGSGARICSYRVRIISTRYTSNGQTRERTLSGTNDYGALSVSAMFENLPVGNYVINLDVSTDNSSNPIDISNTNLIAQGLSDGTNSLPSASQVLAAGDTTTSATYAAVNGLGIQVTLGRQGRIIYGSSFQTDITSGSNETGFVAVSVTGSTNPPAQVGRFVASTSSHGSAALYGATELLQPGTYTITLYHKTDGGTWQTEAISLWAFGTSVSGSAWDLRQSVNGVTYAGVTTTTTGFDTITSRTLHTESATQGFGLFSFNVETAGGGAVARTVQARLFDGVSSVCETISRYLSGSNDLGAMSLVATKAIPIGQCQAFLQASTGSATQTVLVSNVSGAFWFAELVSPFAGVDGCVDAHNLNNNGNDVGPYANHWTTVGTVPYPTAPVKEGLYSAGPFSNSNYFTSTNSMVISAVQPQKSFTLSGWMYLAASTSAAQRFFDARASVNDRISIYTTDDATDLTVVSTYGGVSASMSSTNDCLGTFNWKYVTIVFSPGLVNAYVNGQSVVSANLTRTATAMTTLYIGSVGSTAMNGYADRVRVYNRVLTDSEVTALYEADKPLDPNLKFYWKADNSFFDASGNGYTLTQAGTLPFVQWPVKFFPYAAGVFSNSNYASQVTAGLMAQLQPQSSYRVSWWAWLVASTGANQRFFQVRATSANDRIIAQTSTDSTNANITSVVGGTAYSATGTGAAIKLGVWQNHALVLAPGSVTYYVNGQVAATDNLTRTAATMVQMDIGSVGSVPVNGYIDDFKISLDTSASAIQAEWLRGIKKRKDDLWWLYWRPR